MYLSSSNYGGFQNSAFCEVYKELDSFLDDYNNLGIPAKLKEDSIKTVWYLLNAKYNTSTIAYNSVYQFKLQLFSTIFKFGPWWEKQLELQDRVRTMDFQTIAREGTKAIYNEAVNDSRAPSTNTLQQIPFINKQNVNLYKKGQLETVAQIQALLERDFTTEFINKFEPLFAKIVAPDFVRLYDTEELEENIHGNS